MDEKDSIIAGLAMALKEALNWLYVANKQPPYKVPCEIQGDLWRFETYDVKWRASEAINKAVNKAAGLKS